MIAVAEQNISVTVMMPRKHGTGGQKMASKRLIDANVLKVLFDVRYDTAFIQERTRENKEQWSGYCTGINWGRNTIADAPTVDAMEVVHGRWKSDTDGDPYCSVCRKCAGLLRIESGNYCPSCGAKMDGDGNG